MTASANSTIVVREILPPNQARCATKNQASAAPPPLRKLKSMQQRRVPDEDGHPCRRFQIHRLPDVHHLDAGHGVGPGQRTSTAHGASSVSLSTKPCTAAIINCEMRVEAPMAFGKSQGWARVTSAQRHGFVCGESTCKPTLRGEYFEHLTGAPGKASI